MLPMPELQKMCARLGLTGPVRSVSIDFGIDRDGNRVPMLTVEYLLSGDQLQALLGEPAAAQPVPNVFGANADPGAFAATGMLGQPGSARQVPASDAVRQ